MSLSRKPTMMHCSLKNCSSALFALFPVSLNHGRVISLVESIKAIRIIRCYIVACWPMSNTKRTQSRIESGYFLLKCWSNEPSKRPCFREIQETLCEILMEERREGDETMSRENRRVAVISWSSTGSAGHGVDLPPPKPSRVPATYVGIGGSAGKSLPSASSLSVPSGPTTYLVAPNSEVLAQLIRDNETRADAGHYTSPALAFNRFTVDFSHTSSSNSNPASSQHKSKTKGRKKQPVDANIMMDDATPPSAEIAAAAVATNPAPYKEVRISACQFEQQRTKRTISRPTYGARTEDWKLRQQQRQSEEDSRWLGEEESHMRKKLSVAASLSDRSDTDSMDGANAYQKYRSTPLQGNQLDDRSVVVKKLEPTPTARLDRTHDKVYDATTSFRAVMLLSQGVRQPKLKITLTL
ncbi:hypothetical protein DAPPUDRAFT_110480 [Daphnia pulex]|uniref:Uncharacterized protein n=1 Tax=Daphnia pulex TaxID=6669 RepID=E9H6E0_DAPPU|nr:hypothetical protein DAPPUDRAFT_110480 [Daphnia pulex]|eukprot:EFX72640.1 hypothetical protein DAPPUDRAFT_110480 [Daphnia pulex]